MALHRLAGTTAVVARPRRRRAQARGSWQARPSARDYPHPRECPSAQKYRPHSPVPRTSSRIMQHAAGDPRHGYVYNTTPSTMRRAHTEHRPRGDAGAPRRASLPAKPRQPAGEAAPAVVSASTPRLAASNAPRRADAAAVRADALSTRLRRSVDGEDGGGAGADTSTSASGYHGHHGPWAPGAAERGIAGNSLAGAAWRPYWESPLPPRSSAAAAAAAEEAIARLPRFMHGRVAGDADELECVICMDGVDVGETVIVLPCLHRLHATCGARWLRLNPSCPMCKHRLAVPQA